MDKGNLSGILLIDFGKAFDLINYDLLLQKLAIYGLKDSSLQWFKSYLTERKQLVYIGRATSDLLPVHTGVPQGSSLGPLLFILFINDIPLVNKECNSYIYVDDTTLVKSGTSINTVRSHLQTGADNLSNWASENRMAIHPNKTKVMLIGSRQKLSTINSMFLSAEPPSPKLPAKNYLVCTWMTHSHGTPIFLTLSRNTTTNLNL
jgi:hypothetical protein